MVVICSEETHDTVTHADLKGFTGMLSFTFDWCRLIGRARQGLNLYQKEIEVLHLEFNH